MNIVFDNIIFSLQKAGGISVYWGELISRIENDIRFDKSFIELKSSKFNKFRNEIYLEKSGIVNERNLFINRLLGVKYSVKDNHIFHSSYYRLPKKNKNCCRITTIHDFIPELFNKNLRSKLLSFQKYKSVKESDAVICVSENTKNDLIRLYPEFIKKEIVVIHNGASLDFTPLDNNNSKQAVLEGIKKPFCIFIGKRETYKNFDFAVHYIAQTSDLNLVIVGGGLLQQKEKNLLDSKINGRYHYFSFVSNKNLNILYNNAEFLFYPSEYEGFGIPIVEAQKSGCPFIAKKTSSIVELVEDEDLLLDELTFNKINEARLFIKKNKDLIIAAGLKNSKKYTWEKNYESHISYYENTYSQKFL